MVAKWDASKICATRESEIRVDRRWKDYPLHVFDVSDINALVQAIGYLKFITDGKVYFRGQSKIYENQGRIFPLPSLLRSSVWEKTPIDEKDAAAVDDAARERIYKIISLAGEWPASLNVGNRKERVLLQDDTMVGNDNLACWDVPLYTVEPLLQHYGMETRWLDLTESLPYALFFGLVRYGSKIAVSDADVADPTNVHVLGAYEDARRRSCLSPVFQNIPVYIPDVDDYPQYANYVYLYAISPGAPLPSLTDEDTGMRRKGLSRYSGGYVIDMREAVPSFYLRPHAQHGLLWLPDKSVAGAERDDGIGDVQACVFRIPTEAVLRWLRAAEMFSPSGIYPPLRCRALPSATEHVCLAADSISNMSYEFERVCVTDDAKRSSGPRMQLAMQLDAESSTMERSFSGDLHLDDVDRGFLQWEKQLFLLKHGINASGRSNKDVNDAIKWFGRLQNYITADTLFRDLLGEANYGMEVKQ